MRPLGHTCGFSASTLIPASTAAVRRRTTTTTANSAAWLFLSMNDLLSACRFFLRYTVANNLGTYVRTLASTGPPFIRRGLHRRNGMPRDHASLPRQVHPSSLPSTIIHCVAVVACMSSSVVHACVMCLPRRYPSTSSVDNGQRAKPASSSCMYC